MKITIEIPDTWKDSRYPLICITGDEFFYSSDKIGYGIQSQFSQIDNDKEKELLNHCNKIHEEVLSMLNSKLI